MNSRQFFPAAVLLLVAAALFAQAPASIRGQVSDPSGAAVPQATVTVTGPNGLVKVAQTDSTGGYSVIGLPPGAYTVRIGSTGFALFEKTGIDLAGGRGLTLDAKLSLAAADKQEVTVSDVQQVELDPSKNAGALVLKGDDLEMLSDDPDELQSDLEALAGPSVGPNGGQIFVDGFSNGQLPPKDSIREIRINSNPFSSEFDRVGFGRIEILTKPGTDKFHGTALFEADDGALDSRNPFSTTKASFLSRQFQGNVSGPVNKKASFFIDFSHRNQDESALVNAQILNSNFLPVPFIQSIGTPTSRTSISPRIDYQLTKNITLQARYTLTTSTLQNQGIGQFNLPTQAYNTDQHNQSVQITETWVLNPRTINETRFQYTRSNQTQTASALTPGSALPPGIDVSGAFSSGGPNFSNASDLQNNFELQNYTSMTMGAHFIKAGIRIRDVYDNNSSNANFNSTFTFASLSAYAATAQGIAQGLTLGQILANGGGAFQYSVMAGNPLSKVSQIDAAPYVQDDWRVLPSVTLSLGLRYELQNNIGDKRDFAPRLGLAWGIGGGQGRLRQPKTVIRAGFGIFYDRFALGQVLTAERLNGITEQKYVIPDPGFVCILTSCLGTITPANQLSSSQPLTTYQIDPNLVAPRIIQSAIGVDRQLPKNVTLSVNYTNSRGEHELRSRNINAPLPGTFVLGQSGSGVYPFGNPNPVDQFESGGMFKQSQISANVNARMTAKLQLFGYYVFGHASSNTDGVGTFPASTYNTSTEWSRAAFDVRNRVLVGGNLTAPMGIRLAPMIQFSSPNPFNIVVNQDLNGDGQNNDRPSYATAADNPLYVFSTPYGLLNSRPLPGETVIPRNLGQGFGSFTINVRLSRAWGFGETSTRAAGAGGGGGRGGGGGGGGRGGPGGGFGGRGGGPPGGGRGGAAGGGAAKRYTVTLSAEIRNLLNSVNPGAPVGILGSPLFGESQGLSGGGFGGGGGGGAGQTANRRIEMNLRFSF